MRYLVALTWKSILLGSVVSTSMHSLIEFHEFVDFLVLRVTLGGNLSTWFAFLVKPMTLWPGELRSTSCGWHRDLPVDRTVRQFLDTSPGKSRHPIYNRYSDLLGVVSMHPVL
jgi:hypothetical protein